MKKKLFSLLLVCTLPCLLFAQKTISGADSARIVVDSIMNYAQSKSIYRDRVNWESIRTTVYQKSAQASSVQEVMPAVELIYQLLGDFHGFTNRGRKYYKWRQKKPKPDTLLYRSTLRKMKKGPGVDIRIFDQKYGYLLIPENNPTHKGDNERLAQQLQDSLSKLNPSKLKGIIIDLRTNGGGNMYPMILGVANLLGDGQLGSFIDPVTRKKEFWEIRGKEIYAGDELMCRLNTLAALNTKLKIVVLTGMNTASSGEATAISFKGRKNTWFIGEKTGGYTTANDSFRIFDLNVFMATAVEADRNGVIYDKYVSPDQEILAGDNFEELTNDAKIITALKWLKH